MKPESSVWKQLEDQAAAHLKTGFAADVLRAAHGPSSSAWSELEATAAAHLRAGFADRVLRAVRAAMPAEMPSVFSQFALSVATVAFCLGAVVYVHERTIRLEDERSLADWQQLAVDAQISNLRIEPMQQRVLVALLTVLVFASGFAARVWTETAPAVPAPPKLGGEFGPKSSTPEAKKSIDRKDLFGEIERNKAEIEAYRTRVMAIEADFENGFSGLLKSEQREQYTAVQKKRAANFAQREAKAPTTLSDDQIERLRQNPLYGMYSMLIISERGERLTKDYKLDAQQQKSARELLSQRRDKFIALIDSTPPPSFRLSALAPVVQKLADPKQGGPAK